MYLKNVKEKSMWNQEWNLKNMVGTGIQQKKKH